MLNPPPSQFVIESRDPPAAGSAMRHTYLEDAYAVVTGCGLAVLGLELLKSAELVTGGVAGLALLLSYLMPLPAGVLFALLNIPFFILANRTLGRAATIRSVAANLLISALAMGLPLTLRIQHVNGLFAALAGGTLIGVGLLLLARHQVGLGGLGLLSLMLQKSHGLSPGRTQFIGDCLVLGLAALVIAMNPAQFGLSVVSALAVAGVLIVFHKPGRYTGY